MGVLAMADTAMARGLLMLSPLLMPRLTMVVDSSVRPVHMVDLPTLLASAPLMLMPTTAMVDMVVTATAVAMDTARGLLMPSMVDTAMVVMAMADMAMAS